MLEFASIEVQGQKSCRSARSEVIAAESTTNLISSIAHSLAMALEVKPRTIETRDVQLTDPLLLTMLKRR